MLNTVTSEGIASDICFSKSYKQLYHDDVSRCFTRVVNVTFCLIDLYFVDINCCLEIHTYTYIIHTVYTYIHCILGL